MKDIKIELTRSQFRQLSDLIGKTRSLLAAHEKGEISVPTANNDIKIEWTAQAVEINIPD